MSLLNTTNTWLFDCDGVLLDSNRLKSDAFYELVLNYGEEKAREFVEHHQAHGGVSRYKKIQYFLKHIMGKKNVEQELQQLTQRFGELVRHKLVTCPETKGLRAFLEALPEKRRRYVISGGDQYEVRHVFTEKKLTGYFQGIYGSPDTKLQHLTELTRKNAIKAPAVFVGDSRSDYEASREFGFRFVFMTSYSEFFSWKQFFADKHVTIVSTLDELRKLS